MHDMLGMNQQDTQKYSPGKLEQTWRTLFQSLTRTCTLWNNDHARNKYYTYIIVLANKKPGEKGSTTTSTDPYLSCDKYLPTCVSPVFVLLQ